RAAGATSSFPTDPGAPRTRPRPRRRRPATTATARRPRTITSSHSSTRCSGRFPRSEPDGRLLKPVARRQRGDRWVSLRVRRRRCGGEVVGKSRGRLALVGLLLLATLGLGALGPTMWVPAVVLGLTGA